MKILLLSAYDAASHGYWHKSLLARFPDYDWTVLTLPPRYFAWRLRGNSLSWAFGQRDLLQRPYDLVLATSMTDLSALRGFVPRLAQTPTLVYFHENQFAYPESGQEYGSLEPRMLNLYTALAADRILFNSHYNRDTFLAGVRALLKKMPDQVPPGLPERLAERSDVLPVPLADELYLPHQPRSGELQLVWNHRWEFDKGPELLLQALQQLEAADVPCCLHLVGQQFRRAPAVFTQIREQYADRLGHWGYVESAAAYRRLLQQSDLVLSTALHDFQGIAVLEAVAAGCIPLVPDRLAYTELFPARWRYRSGEGESAALATQVQQYAALKRRGDLPVAPDVAALRWSRLRQAYRRVLEETAALSVTGGGAG